MDDNENKVGTSTKGLEDIAQKLLQSRYILTALELHAETTEGGTEIPQLRDYFSNPSNFELCSKPSGEFLNIASSSTLNRSSSQTTLDSFDWARYSEDGERVLDDKIVVLEFELRKAKETIQGLRDNLTQATAASEANESSSIFGVRKSSNEFQRGELRPHEVCTLNFLINEYLVMRNYKMTANTFADENENQDFENWDDVGLNIPRPPPLGQWLQEKLAEVTPKTCVTCQTDLDGPSMDQLSDSLEEKKFLEEKVRELESRCERQELELQKLHRKMSTPHTTPLGTPHKPTGSEFELDLDASQDSVETGREEVEYNKEETKNMQEEFGRKKVEEEWREVRGTMDGLAKEPLDLNYELEMMNEVDSIEDLIENPSKGDEEPLGSSRESVSTRKTLLFQDVSSDEKERVTPIPAEGLDDVGNEDDQEVPELFSESSETLLDPRKYDRLPPLGASSECSPQGILAGEFVSAQREEAKSLLRESSMREVPQFLETQILGICFGQTLGVDSRLQNEVASLSLGQCDLLDLVSSSLHNIAPNVILAKREELLPLLVYSISQHADGKERERLLYLLFNLTKKPDKEQRGTILLGLVNLARVLGPEKIEEELLPQCWEQLSHKHTERRLLVAQSVAVLAPYTAPPLRYSLLLSMVQQVLGAGGEKETCVREAAMASLTLLISYLDDEEKIPPLVDTLILCLQKAENREYQSKHQTPSNVFLLLSSLAYWTIKANSFSLLMNPLMDHVNVISKEIIKETSEGNKRSRIEQLNHNLINLIRGLEAATPYLFLYLYESSRKKTLNQDTGSPYISSAVTLSFIDELSVILGGRDQAENAVLSLHWEFSQREASAWPELGYISSTVVPRFIEIVSQFDVSSRNLVVVCISFVSKLCAILGPKLTKDVVSPLFLKDIIVSEGDMDSIRTGNSCLTKATLVIYVLAILSEGDARHKDGTEGDLQQFLSRQIAILALSGAPMQSLQLIVLLLMEKLQCHEEVLSALWASVVHRSPKVRAATASLWILLVGHIKEAELASRVIPALVTIATDPDVTVRSSAVMPLSFIVANSASKEVKDKVLLQLESVCEEAQVLENPPLQVAIAQTCSSLGHNTPSNLLHNLFLPCLCRSSLEGSGTPQEKLMFGTSLLEALTALASSPMPDHLVAHFILPPLNQLQKTLGVMSFEHMETITVLTKEYTLRAQSSTSSDRLRTSLSTSGLSSLGNSLSSSVGAMGAGLPIGTGVEDVKNKMSKMFSSTGKSMSTGFQGKGPSINLPALFKKK